MVVGYESADDWAALAACTVIIANGIRFMRMGIGELMDIKPDIALGDEIQRIATKVDGAKYIEKVLVRNMGLNLYVDLHLEVDPSLSVRRAHEIAHAVKDAIMAGRKTVADVLVHVEPHMERG